MDIQIRQERQDDYQQIRELVSDAFDLAEHSDGDEMNIIWFAILAILVTFLQEISNIQMPLAYNVPCREKWSLI